MKDVNETKQIFNDKRDWKRERETERGTEARTHLDNANGNMSHLTFGGLLRALYDKKWRDSGAGTHHQSSPTTLHFSSLCSLTTDPNPPFLRISIRMFKKLPSHLSFLFRKTYWIPKLHIPYFTTFVKSCSERSSLTWSKNKIIYHF